MNAAYALLGAAFSLLLRRSSQLSLSDVRGWIAIHGNPDGQGQGYSGGSLRKGPSRAFAEVSKQPTGSKFDVRVSIYLNPRYGAIASKQWSCTLLDNDLQKFFGEDSRKRILL